MIKYIVYKYKIFKEYIQNIVYINLYGSNIHNTM